MLAVIHGNDDLIIVIIMVIISIIVIYIITISSMIRHSPVCHNHQGDHQDEACDFYHDYHHGYNLMSIVVIMSIIMINNCLLA